MNRREKKLAGTLPGAVGSIVVEGDIRHGIQTWKQDLKRSGILLKVFQNKEFTKPSTKRKRILDAAKYKQKFAHI